ncbi:Fur family transcriptional regulator [Algivirga pacifica]|uniref:Transcriptional repressor n=1 Tax=Algivirga pacifica TaxID=1162670 RepID=A0ABP9DCZ5_9BACT
MSSSIDILNDFSLRRTASRTQILDIFTKHKEALSENDLELRINGMCDRATIYRTLKTFTEKGILHKVIDENNIVKYALCDHSYCSEREHNHDHVHFKCQQCGKTICMNEIAIQHVKLPVGFKALEANFLVIGVCDQCNNA